VIRRLPVLQTPPPEDQAAAERPSWHWVLIGGGFLLTLWLPLAGVGLLVITRGSGSLVRVLAMLLPYLLACAASGPLVGRFGTTGAKQGVLAGGLGAVLAWAMALLSGALDTFLLGVGALLGLSGMAALVSGFFAQWGRRLRLGTRRSTPS
jgi:hypothetical protein